MGCVCVCVGCVCVCMLYIFALLQSPQSYVCSLLLLGNDKFNNACYCPKRIPLCMLPRATQPDHGRGLHPYATLPNLQLPHYGGVQYNCQHRQWINWLDSRALALSTRVILYFAVTYPAYLFVVGVIVALSCVPLFTCVYVVDVHLSRVHGGLCDGVESPKTSKTYTHSPTRSLTQKLMKSASSGSSSALSPRLSRRNKPTYYWVFC